MKALVGFLLSLGVIGYLMIFAWVIFCLCMAIYGLYLAFSASILLGIVALIVEPSPLVIGLVMFFFHKNLAQVIMDYLNK